MQVQAKAYNHVKPPDPGRATVTGIGTDTLMGVPLGVYYDHVRTVLSKSTYTRLIRLAT
jgi:hypothetical protein